ncbi:MAG: histone deacetylase [Desulfobacterales bacterium]|nr:histone deacetylase [Desulfobacterales bacterium]
MIEKSSHKTGVVRDKQFLEHRPAPAHPESPDRLKAVYGLLDSLDFQDRLLNITPRPATREEILLVHAPEYLDMLAATAGTETCALTADTHVSAGSYKTALLAAGGIFAAIEAVVTGALANAFALVRPPGHHAENSRATGYCLFNNIALGAMYARKILGLDRVLLVDWDVHHGNGTQHAFEQDSSVLFYSIHQYPHFPGTGFFTETGRGAGEGYTVNIPLSKGYGDGEYVFFLEHLLRPVALEFQPDLIIVSAGFDTHAEDQMGGMRMSATGFAAMTRVIMNIAAACCAGKLVLTLEGGYHLTALKDSIHAVLLEMSGQSFTDIHKIAEQAEKGKIRHVLKRFLPVQNRFWHNL